MCLEHINLSQKENISMSKSKSKYVLFDRNVKENTDNEKRNPRKIYLNKSELK